MQRTMLPPEIVAELLGVDVRTLYAWRAAGTGPRCYKVGKYLRYDPGDVEAWLAERVA